VTIRVFGSKLNDEPSEEFRAGGVTVRDWLAKNVPSYSDMDVHPISVSLNGEVIPPEQWAICSFAATDTVDIVIEPKGTELFFGALFLVAIKTLTPKIPKVSSTAQNGEGINEASIKGNKVKLNSPIREIAGTRKVYPDYLLPPRRYFAGPREQHVEMLLCIGKGEHEVPTNKILIGDTPVISLGADVEFHVYGPNADLSGNPAHLWWNDVTEVGSSSNGSSGLELTVSEPLTNGYVATSQIFDDYTVTIPSGAGAFPPDWFTGLIVRILVSYQYDFVDGGGGARDIIRGFNLDMLAPSVGDSIEIAGSNAGLYVVNSFTPSVGPIPAEMTLNFDGGAPVTGLTLGSLPASIAPRGQRFRVTVFSGSQITVERLGSTGAVDTDFPGFVYLETASASVTLDPSNLEGGYRGPFAMCPFGEKATAIEWDVFMPSGLCGLGREGQVYEVGAFHQFEWRDMDVAGAWTTIEKTHTGASLDSQGFTNRVDLPYPMRPEARIKKIFIQQSERETEINNDTVWYGARSLLSAPISYAGVTVMSVNARGGDRLSAQSEAMVSVEATRKLPTRLNGAWTALVATRDIAPFFAYVAKNVGYTDSDLDLVELDRLDAIWKARGDHYDQATNTNGTAKGVINDALSCGYSELTVDRGLLRPARDEPRIAFESMYTPQNMTRGLERSFTAVRPDDYDGVDVEYVDGVSWQVETVECRLPGDAGTRVQKIKAEGCTNRTKAWRIGMRQRRALKFRRWEYNWATELDALNSRYLSFVQVADDVPGYAQSAYMISYDNGVIESSEAFDWSMPGPHYVYVRRQDGTSSGAYIATRIDDFHLSISGLDFPPDTSLDREPPHLLFGIGYPVLITSISPSGTESANVEAMTYNVEIYADDDNQVP